MPSLENPGGSFLPMFTFGLLSIMIMGSAKKYAKMLGGYTFAIGDASMNLIKKFLGVTKQNVSRSVAGFKKVVGENIVKMQVNKEADEILEEAKDVEE